MPFRFRRSVKIAPGVRLSVGKKSASVRLGGRGFGYSVSTSGRRTVSAGVPGTGLSWVSASGGTSGRPGAKQVTGTQSVSVDAALPKPGLFASGAEKALRRALVLLGSGDSAKCAHELSPFISATTSAAILLVHGFASAKAGSDADAIRSLERVVLEELVYPDALAGRYLAALAIGITVGIVPGIQSEVDMDPAGAALLLAELYQSSGRSAEAIELLESLGEVGVEPELMSLSLAELYGQAEQWDDVLRVADPEGANDDVTTATLVFRAMALRELGLFDAALETHKATLRSRKRGAGVLNFARYERSRTYGALGNSRMERKDLEAVFAADPTFADVRVRLGLKAEAAVERSE